MLRSLLRDLPVPLSPLALAENANATADQAANRAAIARSRVRRELRGWKVFRGLTRTRASASNVLASSRAWTRRERARVFCPPSRKFMANIRGMRGDNGTL